MRAALLAAVGLGAVLATTPAAEPPSHVRVERAA
jgi:hypothetical protein